MVPVPDEDADAHETYRRVGDRLRDLDSRLQDVDSVRDSTIESEMLRLHDELDELGLLQLLTPGELVPISPDNLPDTLSDRAGVAAVRTTLRTLARLASARATLGPEGWQSSDWDVLVVRRDGVAPSHAFVRELCFELGNQWNLAAFYAPDRVRPAEESVYPPAGVTATNDPSFREWTLSWGGALLWWEEGPESLRLRLENASVSGDTEEFGYSDMLAAAHRAAELIAEGLPELDAAAAQVRDASITIGEHRALEATLRIVVEQSETVMLSAEDQSQLQVLIETLQLQLRAPVPDRPIIGRVLRGLATLAGGALLGVAGNYLADLLKRFGVPWP